MPFKEPPFDQEGGQYSGTTVYTVEDAVYSPDGTRLATAGVRGATVWDTASYQALVTLTGHEGGINKILYTSDGNLE